MEIGSYTKPINTAGGSIILQVTDIKEISVQEIDKETEFLEKYELSKVWAFIIKKSH